MKIAIVLPVVWNPAEFSADPRRFLTGFHQLGIDAQIVCVSGSVIPAGTPASTVLAARLTSEQFWRELDIDAAVVFTWMGFLEVIDAIRRAGVVAISKADTDGMLGVRVHPRATATRAISPARSPLDTARRVWHWTKRYAYLHRGEDTRLLKTLASADATIVETPAARANLLRLLERHDAAALASRLHVIHMPVEDIYCDGPLDQKEGGVICVGRWLDPAKDAHLLRRTLAKVPDIHVTIAGANGAEIFGDLPGRVQCVGRVPPSELQRLYARAAVCLITSRWEGNHNAGHEALAMGCTIVGTAIPAVDSMTGDGQFGAMVPRRTPDAITIALKHELATWANGGRDPSTIAEYWRPLLAPVAVASRIVDLINRQPRRT